MSLNLITSRAKKLINQVYTLLYIESVILMHVNRGLDVT